MTETGLTWGDRSRGACGGTSVREHLEEHDRRDVFTKDLELPRSRERRPVRERDRVYEINGTDSPPVLFHTGSVPPSLET